MQQYNHRIIKMNLFDVKPSIYIDVNKKKKFGRS